MAEDTLLKKMRRIRNLMHTIERKLEENPKTTTKDLYYYVCDKYKNLNHHEYNIALGFIKYDLK